MTWILQEVYPDSKVHGANMEPIWSRQEPDGPHVGPMNFVIWVMHQTQSWAHLMVYVVNVNL